MKEYAFYVHTGFLIFFKRRVYVCYQAASIEEAREMLMKDFGENARFSMSN